MTDIIDITAKLKAEEAERKIREIVKYGSITLSNHCKYERLKNRNYDIHDINLVLSKGKVLEPPEWDSEFNNWKYKIEGNSVEGDKTVVIVAFINHRELLCITIMPK